MSRTKPCRRCGGVKDRGLKGASYCQACFDELSPVWRQNAKERDLAKQRQRRLAEGKKPRAKKINADGQVWCARCATYMHPGRFALTNGKPQAYCRTCSKTYNHENRLKAVFNIDIDEYNRMLDIQGGCCAICLCRPNTMRLAVDHNHRTGEIRGLLCKRCNHNLLGTARDSTEMLERAICYLESPPAVTGVAVVIHEDFVMPARRGQPAKPRASDWREQ